MVPGGGAYVCHTNDDDGSNRFHPQRWGYTIACVLGDAAFAACDADAFAACDDAFAACYADDASDAFVCSRCSTSDGAATTCSLGMGFPRACFSRTFSSFLCPSNTCSLGNCDDEGSCHTNAVYETTIHMAGSNY